MTHPQPNEPLIVELARCRARGVHQYAIAADAGVTPVDISRYAHGHRLPEPEIAKRIASALGKPVCELFSEFA